MKRIAILSSILLLFPLLANAQNQPPVADAGPDRNAYTNGAIDVQGSGYDPDGEPIIIWQWIVDQAPPGATWDLYGTDRPQCRFAGYYPGDYVLTLWVEDPSGVSAPDYMTVFVRDNLPPVAVAAADTDTVAVGDSVCFDGSASYDPEGGPLVYFWTFGDQSPDETTPLTCHTYLEPGQYHVRLMVVDERDYTDYATVDITVVEGSASVPPMTWGTIKELFK